MRSWAFSIAITIVFVTPFQLRAELILGPGEIEKVLRHGPWPSVSKRDPSNRVSGNQRAISLGKQLFNDPLLSNDQTMSCASCHRSDLDFTDGRPTALGRKPLDRNTQPLWNLRGQRWFGWSGDADNLWAKSLAPIINSNEMANDPISLQTSLKQSPYLDEYETVFDAVATETPDLTLVNIGKALAAYLETLETGKTSFDTFRDALARGDLGAAKSYPLSAQRGLQIFVGDGNCAFCHSGPAFTNGEFHDAGVSYFLNTEGVDAGRSAGLEALEQSPFTLDGSFSDELEKTGGWAVRNVRFQHSNFGIFRVPTLRRVTETAPYMHDGSLLTLKSVLNHYNEIDMERLHSDGEAILRPLRLTARELSDIENFLTTLSDD
jgi:cytochrome c peroxidase